MCDKCDGWADYYYDGKWWCLKHFVKHTKFDYRAEQ